MMKLKDLVKKLLRRKEADMWNLQNCKMIDMWWSGEMDSKTFDKKVRDHEMVVPIIDGYAYTYLSTPAYAIIVKRHDKVDLNYGK